MKKFTFLMLAMMGLASSAMAQDVTYDLPLTGGWGYTKVFSGTVTVTSSDKWGEFKLSAESFSCATYPKFRITYTGAGEDEWQMKIENESGGKQYPIFEAGDGVMEIAFNTENFATDQTITTFNLQHRVDTESSITITKVELLDASDNATQTSYATNWGCTATSDSKIFTFTSQWGELGGWAYDFNEGDTHVFTIKLNSPAPANFQFKVYSPDGYPAINEGDTEASFTLTNAYEKVTIQYKGTEPATLDIASMQLTIKKPWELYEDSEPPLFGAYGTALDVVNVNRTFNKGWNTLAVPFVITPPTIKEQFGENVKVYGYTGYEDGVVKFNKIDLSGQYSWSIAGWSPVLIYIADDDVPAVVNGKLTVKGTQVAGNENTDKTSVYAPATWVNDGAGGVFQGSFDPVASADLTGNYGVTAEGAVKKASSSATCLGYRAYLKNIPSSSDAKALSIAFDGNTTGITTIVAADDVFTEGATYNLGGQRVDSANLKPGIYVRNGKKYIKK